MNNPALTDRSLSEPLEMMVQQALISAEIAAEFNSLPTEDLQRKAVERYCKERQVLARMIVSDFKRRTIALAVADVEVESAAQIQNRIDQIPPLSWQELSQEFFSGMKSLVTLGSRLRRNVLGIGIILGVAWILRPDTPRPRPGPTAAQSLPRVAAELRPARPLHRPSGVVQRTRIVSVPRETQTVAPFPMRPLYHGELPPPPKNLVLELVHGKEAVLRWNSLPGTYHYNMYWASAKNPTYFQKAASSPLMRPSMIWPFPSSDPAYLIRVTSLDGDGHESAPSSPLRIDLSPAF